MEHYLDNNQQRNSLYLVKNITKFLQIASLFYAFFTLIYWLLLTSEFPGIEALHWFFKPLWDIVGIFYQYRPVVNEDNIDFTGVICAVCLILISNASKTLYDFLITVELNLQNTKKKSKNKSAVKTAMVKKSFKDIVQFIFILDVKITNVTNFIQEDKLSQEEIDTLKQKFYEALLNNLNHNQIVQKGFFKKNLYLIYKDFDYIDDFIFYTRETLNSLSREFTKPTLRIDFLVALSSMTHNDDLNQSVNILDTIICLNLRNEFIATSDFKSHYDIRQKRQYRLVTKGVYNLSKNLNVTNNQEIYSLRENS